MTIIEIPDDQAAILKARAAARGLTLEAWLRQIAEAPPSQYRLEELLAGCDAAAPQSGDDREWLEAPPVGREVF